MRIGLLTYSEAITRRLEIPATLGSFPGTKAQFQVSPVVGSHFVKLAASSTLMNTLLAGDVEALEVISSWIEAIWVGLVGDSLWLIFFTLNPLIACVPSPPALGSSTEVEAYPYATEPTTSTRAR